MRQSLPATKVLGIWSRWRQRKSTIYLQQRAEEEDCCQLIICGSVSTTWTKKVFGVGVIREKKPRFCLGHQVSQILSEESRTVLDWKTMGSGTISGVTRITTTQLPMVQFAKSKKNHVEEKIHKKE